MTDIIEIGDWSFSPRSAELRGAGGHRALEDRAARVLALLASRRGEVVGQDELIAQVWGGRSVSANSVAVVIGDLRRALGDDAKAPRYIETIAKRGYRLALQEAPTPAAPLQNRWRNRWLIGLAAAAGAFVFAGALMASNMQAASRVSVAVADVSNETGDARYAPLARAVTELIVSSTASNPQALRVTRGGTQSHIVVNGRLILWSGHPSVSLSAVNRGTGQVLWSGIAPGPEDSLPSQVGERVEELKRALSH